MPRFNLEQSISIKIPKASNATFQSLPDLGVEESVVCFWKKKKLQCIVSADSQPAGLEESVYWDELDEAIKEGSYQVKLVKEGMYESLHEGQVTYRVYRDSKNGDESTQVYHLIRNETIAYWVIATLQNYEDIFNINRDIINLVKTAKLKA